MILCSAIELGELAVCCEVQSQRVSTQPSQQAKAFPLPTTKEWGRGGAAQDTPHFQGISHSRSCSAEIKRHWSIGLTQSKTLRAFGGGPRGAIKSVGHSHMECGGKRSATPLWLER